MVDVGALVRWEFQPPLDSHGRNLVFVHFPRVSLVGGG